MKITDEMFEKYGNPFSSLETEAFHTGYDLKVDDEFNLSLELLEHSECTKYCPEITITKVIDSDSGEYFYTANLKFPELDTSKLTWYDDLIYWTDKWNEISKFIVDLTQFSFNPEEYFSDEE